MLFVMHLTIMWLYFKVLWHSGFNALSSYEIWPFRLQWSAFCVVTLFTFQRQEDLVTDFKHYQIHIVTLFGIFPHNFVTYDKVQYCFYMKNFLWAILPS